MPNTPNNIDSKLHQMNILKQLSIILTIYITCEISVKYIPLPIPASVIGLLAILLLLKSKIIKEQSIKDSASFITENMAMFFVPVCLKILDDFATFKDHLLPILIIVLTTLIITFLSSTYITILVQKIISRKKI